MSAGLYLGRFWLWRVDFVLLEEGFQLSDALSLPEHLTEVFSAFFFGGVLGGHYFFSLSLYHLPPQERELGLIFLLAG